MHSVYGCHEYQLIIISAPPSDKEYLERIICNVVFGAVDGLFIHKYISNMSIYLVYLDVNHLVFITGLLAKSLTNNFILCKVCLIRK